MPRRPDLRLERMEDRAPVASLVTGGTAFLAGGTLTVNGTAGNDHILIRYENGLIAVRDQSGLLGRFNPAQVANIAVTTGAGKDLVKIASNVQPPATIDGGPGKNLLQAGGGATTITGGTGASKLVGGTGANTLNGGPGSDLIVGGSGANRVTAGGGADKVVRVKPGDVVAATPGTRVLVNNPRPAPAAGGPQETLTKAEVATLLRRAAGATFTDDAIIAIVDRNGRVLGVRTEAGVAAEITGNVQRRVFAIDGAVSKARTGAFFASNAAPLTSRTVGNMSQSTITQREVESIPSIPDANSTLRGPGFVAPVGVGGHFPPNVPNTPEVDLFAIEHTNRDQSFNPGADNVLGTADDIKLSGRFDIDPAFVPAGKELLPPNSYGFEARVLGPMPDDNRVFQNRGVATLPGGIPLYKNSQLVGGIGVFFPGKTGYATEENSSLGTTFDPTKPDRSLEAEYIAFATAGGSGGPPFNRPIGTIAGVPKPDGFNLPGGRIDLVGITLDVFGPGGFEGPKKLTDLGALYRTGNPDSGVNQPVNGIGDTLLAGRPVPEGWLVVPHDGVGISGAEVRRIIEHGILQANRTRAAIRLPLSRGTRMIFAVTDRTGEVLGLYRMPDATVFSIDVAVAKARNTAYYADRTALQAEDRLFGIPDGTAFTNRTFRFLALPRFPSAVDGNAPAPFSILLDGGANLLTGRQLGPRLPASAHDTALGHDAFFPGTNFRDPENLAHRNGVVWFPGSAPLYRGRDGLIGGFGVSGDGVDQDDVVTTAGQVGFEVFGAPRADQVFFAKVRLPYQKYNRNPEAF